LPCEEGTDQNREGDRMPAQSREDAECDDRRHGEVNRENPLQRKSPNASAPESERHVQAKDQCRDTPERHLDPPLHIPWSVASLREAKLHPKSAVCLIMTENSAQML